MFEWVHIVIMVIIGVQQIVQFPEPSMDPAENDARSTNCLAQPNPYCSIPTFGARQLVSDNSYLTSSAYAHARTLKSSPSTLTANPVLVQIRADRV